jgi:Dyp-type peroxidase family
MAQPTIEGLSRIDSPENTVAAGEFILGYKNSYDQYPDTPTVNELTGKDKILPVDPVTGMGDLGKNGTYLVFRQMEQDVELFWKYMEKATSVNGECDSSEMIKLASKIVGRWPGGAPISVCPDKDDELMQDKDSFGYHSSDKEGLKCPIGSHIRRTNPRDTMDENMKASIEIANKHRLIRRGRSYGKPVCENLNPTDILNSKHFEGERGLYFICINTDISRQFEFIQNAWVNNPKLFHLYDERDPLIGNNDHPEDKNKTGVFSIPAKGLRKRYTDIPQFVNVKGGAYFFIPGLKALSYLSSI